MVILDNRAVILEQRTVYGRLYSKSNSIVAGAKFVIRCIWRLASFDKVISVINGVYKAHF